MEISGGRGGDGDELGDIFGSTLSLEEAHKEEGYRQGFDDGVAAGREEAEQLGIKHGFAIGEELGFYRGCVHIWEAAIGIDPSAFTVRVRRGIRQIGELVEGYPMLDPENESTQDALEAIRLRFRAVTASLSLRLDFPKSGDGSKATEF
ncbi:unnamed protein product [Spirodela intermedia]|uniref:Essential protein Yae1 N-terminal domain-containing protein n=2 Tax=Spirodela intermedia TaxID=51605 RepID=A0A7I8K9L4_SPIIN|nr:unnamed protein product [Spirodela intermedia]CAA6658235.1 unnamed protein product [Spirodela intermedia]CAA7394420.1 unnamed protein product [Spirodela intermedia]